MIPLSRSTLALCAALALAGCAIAPETNAPDRIASYEIEAPPAAPENNTPAPAPSLHAGDVWTDKVAGTDKRFIVGAEKSDGTIFIDQWGNETATTPELNVKTWRSLKYADASPTYFDPTLRWFDFPLTPGKRWHADSKWKDPSQSVSGNASCDGAARKWEKVSVPAGDFDALRVDVSCKLTGRGHGADQIDLTYWWVPSVNRFVKYDYREGRDGAVEAAMVSYQPAK